MPRFTGQLIQNTVATTNKSLGVLFGLTSAPRRMEIYEFDLGQSGGLTPTNDTQMLYDVSRFTTTSIVAGTAFTPNPLDFVQSASTASLLINMTAELTAITANSSLLNPPINQRGTFRWRSLEVGDNLVIPATAQSGIVVRVLSLSYTGTAQGTVMYIE